VAISNPNRPHPDFPAGTAVVVVPPRPGALDPERAALVGRSGRVVISRPNELLVEFPGVRLRYHFRPSQVRADGADARLWAGHGI